MSLPTPPSTSHRDNENRVARFSSISRVAWSEKHQYHTVPSSPPRRLSVESSAKKAPPAKSILKPTSLLTLPFEEEFQKEVTPEPSDPLVDLNYLAAPVSRVVATDASLRDLIEAYSILAARIRACVCIDTDADATWPLFQPLRRHRDAFVDALVRDLGRALVDPATVAPSSSSHQREEQEQEDDAAFTLPSPRGSPKKKRGMSAEEVKYARDLCTVSHSVIKLLNVMFTLPALHQIFTGEQLRFILTHILAIPIATELPTPNARKTCALSIWLLQTQRLPEDVLAPAKDRIVYALRRAIEGELGKEGKKGSNSDGLKAIHELSMCYPTLFVPAFTELLPSMLSNLLAPTLVLRAQACHALGGFAYAAASIPTSAVHTRISNVVAAHISTSSSTPTSGPISPSRDPMLIRTLRTTLAATDPKHAAQGPVWAWSVMANLVVLLGPGLYLSEKVARSISALFSLGMRHQKSSVRALGCLTWRCMIWAYFHDPPVRILSAAGEDEQDDYDSDDELQADESVMGGKRYAQRMDSGWKIVQSVVDMGAGVTTVGALLAGQSTDEVSLKRAVDLLGAMSKKGGHTCKDALDAAVKLVSCEPETEWSAYRLLPPGLFCAMPGLLTAEYKTLPQTVKPLFEQCAQALDLRPLTKTEICMDFVFNGLLNVWKEGLYALKLSWGCELPPEILDIWQGVLKTPIAVLQDADDVEGIAEFAEGSVGILIDLLKDRDLDLSLDAEEDSEHVPASPIRIGHQVLQIPPTSRWNLGLKLYLVREHWNILGQTLPQTTLGPAAEKFLTFLIVRENELLEDIDLVDEVRYQWSSLCAEIVYACDAEELAKFWNRRLLSPSQRQDRSWAPSVRRAVWLAFVDKWRECAATWEVAVILLGVPFTDLNAWDMTSEDIESWDKFLQDVMNKALDYGVDSVSVIDQVASVVSSATSPTFSSSTRAADLLLTKLEIAEARSIPTYVIEFTNDSLVSSYPPEPRNKVAALWLFRSLTRVIDACPVELTMNLFELLQEGLCLWIADEYEVFTADEYAMDILPVYQTLLLGIQSLSMSADTIETLAPVLESAFCGRQDKPDGANQAFEEFWQAKGAGAFEPLWGWSERIKNCLQAISGEPRNAVPRADKRAKAQRKIEASADDADESNDALFAEDEVDDEQTVLDELLPPSSDDLPLSIFALPPSSPVLSAAGTPPSTPKTSTQPLPSTPPRPHKPPSSALVASISLATPPRRAPATPKRSPRSTPRRAPTSSARRRSAGTSNKENVSPLPVFATVAERIAARSPAAAASVLGKRRLIDDEDDDNDEGEDENTDGHALKKSRLQLSPRILSAAPQADADCPGHVRFQPGTPRAPQRTLPKTPRPKRPEPADGAEDSDLGFLDSDSDSEECSPGGGGGAGTAAPQASAGTPRPLKRKGMFLDAVEVPTFRTVLRLERRASLQSALGQRVHSFDAASSSGSVTPKRPLRRTRSASRLFGEGAAAARLGPEALPRKRRRDDSSDPPEDVFSTPPLPSSPLRALREAPIAGSDDSIMLATPTKIFPGQLSSDDDPHAGHVSPLGVVSPAPRRAQPADFDVASSDDSVMSSSPSRELVKRRIARMPRSRSLLGSSPLRLHFGSAGGSSLLGSDD